MTLKVLDLFSGIGGFSLGLERTGGFETVAFCEIEKFPQKVLKKNWPKVPIYEDVTKLTADIIRQDRIEANVITGGFPCQDLSSAGKRGGIEAERSGLWSEIVRLVSDLRPDFVIIENVADLLVGPTEQHGQWFCKVLTDLAQCGYDAEWENIPSCALGGWSIRERVWVLAYPNENRLQGLRPISQFYPTTGARLQAERLQIYKTNYDGLCSGIWTADAGRVFGMDNELSDRSHRIAALGNTVDPRIVEMIGGAILRSLQ